MTFAEFSNKIIQTGDIDADYIFLIKYKKEYGEQMAFELVKKKLLIYNLKSELLYTEKIINSDEIKFGNERQKSKRFFKEWEKILSPITIEKFKKFNGVDYLIFRENFKKIKGMGDWASWKCADILEKVFGIKMKYNDLTFLVAYEFPLKGLLMVNDTKEDINIYKDKKIFLNHLYNAKNLLKNVNATEYFDANNILELETLLCKYHSYKHSKYKPQEDLNKIMKIKLDKRLIKYHNLLQW